MPPSVLWLERQLQGGAAAIGPGGILSLLEACSGRFDPISAPVLRALKQILERGRAHNKPIALCGELASRPLEALEA